MSKETRRMKFSRMRPVRFLVSFFFTFCLSGLLLRVVFPVGFQQTDWGTFLCILLISSVLHTLIVLEALTTFTSSPEPLPNHQLTERQKLVCGIVAGALDVLILLLVLWALSSAHSVPLVGVAALCVFGFFGPPYILPCLVTASLQRCRARSRESGPGIGHR